MYVPESVMVSPELADVIASLIAANVCAVGVAILLTLLLSFSTLFVSTTSKLFSILVLTSTFSSTDIVSNVSLSDKSPLSIATRL